MSKLHRSSIACIVLLSIVWAPVKSFGQTRSCEDFLTEPMAFGKSNFNDLDSWGDRVVSLMIEPYPIITQDVLNASEKAFAEALAVDGDVQTKMADYIRRMGVPPGFRKWVFGVQPLRSTFASLGFFEAIKDGASKDALAHLSSYYVDYSAQSAGVQVWNSALKNRWWLARLRKKLPQAALTAHLAVDDLLLRFGAFISSPMPLHVYLAMKNGLTIAKPVPDKLAHLSPKLKSLEALVFNPLFLDHSEPHLANLLQAAEFRTLETKMERARTSAQRAEVFAQMQAFGFARMKHATSFSVFAEEVFLAPQHVARGRDFQIASQDSMVELVKFKSDLIVTRGLKPTTYTQTYVIAICVAPVGQKCKSRGREYSAGEVISFFPECGPFVLRFPSLKRIRQRYIDELDVTDYYLKRQTCPEASEL